MSRQKRRVKQGVGRGEEEEPGADVEGQASKVVGNACSQGQGFPSVLGHRTEKASGHRATGLSKA